MKKIIIYLFLLFFSTSALAIENTEPSAVRLQCKGDIIKRTKNNDVVGDVYTFLIKNGQVYDNEGKLIKNAVIADDYVKGIARYTNGLSIETIKFSINRYSGAFSYYRTYTTLDKKLERKNTGICEVVKNEKMF